MVYEWEMESTVICYYKKNKLSACEYNEPELLGREVYEDINEFVLPVNRKNTPFFITKKFSNQEILKPRNHPLESRVCCWFCFSKRNV